jgi:hypothetical protein
VGVTSHRIVLSVTYDVNPGDDARQLRSLFDKDSNGTLDPPERELLLRYLEQTATLFLKVELGGAPVNLVPTERIGYRLELPRDSTETLGISLVYLLDETAKDPIALRIDDRNADAKIDVPVVVDLEPGLRVAFANQGELHPREGQIHRVRLHRDLPLILRVVGSGGKTVKTGR